MNDDSDDDYDPDAEGVWRFRRFFERHDMLGFPVWDKRIEKREQLQLLLDAVESPEELQDGDEHLQYVVKLLRVYRQHVRSPDDFLKTIQRVRDLCKKGIKRVEDAERDRCEWCENDIVEHVVRELVKGQPQDQLDAVYSDMKTVFSDLK